MPPKRQASVKETQSKKSKMDPKGKAAAESDSDSDISPPQQRRRSQASRRWTNDDTYLLKETTYSEMKALRRAEEIHGCSLYDFIPASEEVDTSENKDIETRGRTITNSNWSDAFSKAMAEVLCIPCFEKRPDFVHYAIMLAMYYRVEGRDYPDVDKLKHARYEGMIDRMFPGVEFTARQIELAKSVLAEDLGPDMPPHFAFTKCIKEVVLAAKRKSRVDRITRADIVAISKAWDDYAAKRRNMVLLKPSDEYQKCFNKVSSTKPGKVRDGDTKQRENEAWEAKRRWLPLLWKRQEDWRKGRDVDDEEGREEGREEGHEERHEEGQGEKTIIVIDDSLDGESPQPNDEDSEDDSPIGHQSPNASPSIRADSYIGGDEEYGEEWYF